MSSEWTKGMSRWLVRAWIACACAALAPGAGAGAAGAGSRSRSTVQPTDAVRAQYDPGDFVAKYEPPLTSDYRTYHDELRRERFLDSVAAELNRLLQVPGNVTLRLAECGHSTTTWSRESRTVTVCYEFLEAVIALAGEGAHDASALSPQAERWFGGAVAFALFGEVGRALAELYSAPDARVALAAGDDFAALALAAVERDGDDAGAAAVEFFEYVLKDPASGFEYVETHEFDAARLQRVACLLYGSAPRSLRGAVERGVLPASRAPGCAAELSAAEQSWERLLGARLR